MSKSKWLPLLIIVSIALTSCNKKLKDIFSRNTGELVVDDFEFDYFTSKAKIDFESENKNLSFTANIRMQKDSVIWMSLSPALGIEAARVLITPDTISFINKVDKVYSIYSFRELSDKFKFDLDFRLVQAVILGNLIYPYDKEKVSKRTNYYTYRQIKKQYFFENNIGARSMKLEKVNVKDSISGNSIGVSYGDFQLVQDQPFPFAIDAKLVKKASDDHTEVEIEYKQAQVEEKPIKFPFNISSKYERK